MKLSFLSTFRHEQSLIHLAPKVILHVSFYAPNQPCTAFIPLALCRLPLSTATTTVGVVVAVAIAITITTVFIY